VIALKCFNNFSEKLIDEKLSEKYYFLGEVEYAKSLDIQTELVTKLKTDHHLNENYILGLEHPTVVTLGLRAHKTSLSDLGLDQLNFPIFKINRGGLATIHNPGQLVVYPILNIKKTGLSVKDFVHCLFLATQKTLLHLGIQSEIDLCDNPGVYTQNGKIAFCGLQIQNGISSHGLSINIFNDLNIFTQIQSCGLTQAKFDSVKNHGLNINVEQFFKLWSGYLNLQNLNRCQKSRPKNDSLQA